MIHTASGILKQMRQIFMPESPICIVRHLLSPEFTGSRNGSPSERLLCRNDVQQFALDVDDFPDFLAVSELRNGFVSKSLGLDVIF